MWEITDEVKNHEYNVGDIVTIIPEEAIDENGDGYAYRCVFVGDMHEYCNQSFVISEKYSYNTYYLRGVSYSWSPEMFQESYELPTIEPKDGEFTIF